MEDIQGDRKVLLLWWVEKIWLTLAFVCRLLLQSRYTIRAQLRPFLQLFEQFNKINPLSTSYFVKKDNNIFQSPYKFVLQYYDTNVIV